MIPSSMSNDLTHITSHMVFASNQNLAFDVHRYTTHAVLDHQIIGLSPKKIQCPLVDLLQAVLEPPPQSIKVVIDNVKEVLNNKP